MLQVPPVSLLPPETLTSLSLSQALRSHDHSTKPLYVSVGHKMSLEAAVRLVRSCCRFRIPEPVRQVGGPARRPACPVPTAGRPGCSVAMRGQVCPRLRDSLVGLHWALLGEEGTGGRRPRSSARGILCAPARSRSASCVWYQGHWEIQLMSAQVVGHQWPVPGPWLCLTGPREPCHPAAHSHGHFLWAWDPRWLLMCRRPPGGSSRPRSAALSPC